jgi:hypothetical protein
MAEGMDDMLVSINSNLDAIEKVMELLLYLSNLTTDFRFNVNQVLIDVDPVMREQVYSGLITLPTDEDKVFPGVKAVNDFTRRYVTDDLTDFINSVWAGGCVPAEWARASEITGEDISGWNVCP